MKSGEIVSKSVAESEWDTLRPENNGLGEFSNIETTREAETDHLETRKFDDPVPTPEPEPPIMIDSYKPRHAWEPGNTDLLACNVLDESWFPDLDDARPAEMTIDKRLLELSDRTRFLDDLEKYQKTPDPDDDWRFKDIDQTIAVYRTMYLEQLEKQKQNPNEHLQDIAVKNTHNWLVMVRTYKYLLGDPDGRRKEIEYERTGLLQVKAARDERYGAAFMDVDENKIRQRTDEIINRISQQEFRELAELMDDDLEKADAFKNKVFDVANSVLGINPDNKAEVFHYEDNKSYDNGYCQYQGSGKSTVHMNMARVKDAIQYAKTAMHETSHTEQHLVGYYDYASDEGRFYNYCFAHYVPASFDYGRYRAQYVEKEAFCLGEEFGTRLAMARAKLENSPKFKLQKFWNRLKTGRNNEHHKEE